VVLYRIEPIKSLTALYRIAPSKSLLLTLGFRSYCAEQIAVIGLLSFISYCAEQIAVLELLIFDLSILIFVICI
jgi:hypothetical protein